MNKSLNCIIRPLRSDETFLLKDFLYEAIFVPEGVEPPSRTVVDMPELRVYIDDFGKIRMTIALLLTVEGRLSVPYGAGL